MLAVVLGSLKGAKREYERWVSGLWNIMDINVIESSIISGGWMNSENPSIDPYHINSLFDGSKLVTGFIRNNTQYNTKS